VCCWNYGAGEFPTGGKAHEQGGATLQHPILRISIIEDQSLQPLHDLVTLALHPIDTLAVSCRERVASEFQSRP
jgi:hypothetical protein